MIVYNNFNRNNKIFKIVIKIYYRANKCNNKNHKTFNKQIN